MKNLLIVITMQIMLTNLVHSQTDLAGFCHDNSGNVYCGGSFKSVIDLGGNNIINDRDSSNIFIAKYDGKGICTWASRYGSVYPLTLSGISCDATGNTYVTGTFSSTTRFRNIQISSSTTKTYPSPNFYLMKLNVSGDPLWVKTSKNAGHDAGYEVTCDASGNIYVAGIFDKEFECDGKTVFSKGKTDMFIMKLSSLGAVQWVKSYGDSEENSCNAIFYAGERLYTSTTIAGDGGYKALLICSSAATGDVLWTKELGASRGSIEAITVSQDKSVFVTGCMESRNTVDARELVIAKYMPDGTDVWMRRFTGGFPMGRAIAVDQNNIIYITGEFCDSLRMDKHMTGGYPKDDIFFAKIAANGAVQNLIGGGNSKPDKGCYLQLVNNKVILGGIFTDGLNFGKVTIKGSNNTVFVGTYDKTKNTIEEMKVLVNEVVGKDSEKVTDIYGKLLLGSGVNKTFLSDQPLYLEDQNGSILKRTVTDEKGDFSFKNVNAGNSMNLVIENNKNIKENEEIYLTTQTGIIIDKTTMKEGKFKFPIIQGVASQLEEMIEEDVSLKFDQFLVNGKEMMVTERILYQESSWSIPPEAIPYLNKIIQYMKKNSRVRVEINSHTDALGDDEFNKKLSVVRAEEVKEFLVQRKISAARITVNGHGEEKIVNRCVEGVNCSESEHAFNRRTEFRFYLASGL